MGEEGSTSNFSPQINLVTIQRLDHPKDRF